MGDLNCRANKACLNRFERQEERHHPGSLGAILTQEVMGSEGSDGSVSGRDGGGIEVGQVQILKLLPNQGQGFVHLLLGT